MKEINLFSEDKDVRVIPPSEAPTVEYNNFGEFIDYLPSDKKLKIFWGKLLHVVVNPANNNDTVKTILTTKPKADEGMADPNQHEKVNPKLSRRVLL